MRMRTKAKAKAKALPARPRPGAGVWIALLLLPVGLALAFRDFFRESLVVPLLYALWLGYEYAKSLPQAAWWGLFLFAGGVWVLRSWPKPRIDRTRRRPDGEAPLGRVESWRERIHLAQRSRGGYGLRYLENHLGKLALRVLADRRRVEPARLRREILAGRLNEEIPAEALRALLRGFAGPPEQPAPGAPYAPTGGSGDLEPLLGLLEAELRLTRPAPGAGRESGRR